MPHGQGLWSLQNPAHGRRSTRMEFPNTVRPHDTLNNSRSHALPLAGTHSDCDQTPPDSTRRCCGRQRTSSETPMPHDQGLRSLQNPAHGRQNNRLECRCIVHPRGIASNSRSHARRSAGTHFDYDQILPDSNRWCCGIPRTWSGNWRLHDRDSWSE